MRCGIDLRYGVADTTSSIPTEARSEVENGCLRFVCAGGGGLPAGGYQIPHQSVSLILLGLGSNISLDALRILARDNTGLTAVGKDLRSAAGCSRTHQSGPAAKPAPGRSGRPLGSGATVLCPALGEMLPARDFDVLRCIEGAPMKETYKLVTGRIGISRSRRREASSSADAAFIRPITRSLLAAMHCPQVCEVPDCRHPLTQMRDSQVFLHNCAVDSRCVRSRSLAQMHQGGS